MPLIRCYPEQRSINPSSDCRALVSAISKHLPLRNPLTLRTPRPVTASYPADYSHGVHHFTDRCAKPIAPPVRRMPTRSPLHGTWMPENTSYPFPLRNRVPPSYRSRRPTAQHYPGKLCPRDHPFNGRLRQLRKDVQEIDARPFTFSQGCSATL